MLHDGRISFSMEYEGMTPHRSCLNWLFFVTMQGAGKRKAASRMEKTSVGRSTSVDFVHWSSASLRLLGRNELTCCWCSCSMYFRIRWGYTRWFIRGSNPFVSSLLSRIDPYTIKEIESLLVASLMQSPPQALFCHTGNIGITYKNRWSIATVN